MKKKVPFKAKYALRLIIDHKVYKKYIFFFLNILRIAECHTREKNGLFCTNLSMPLVNMPFRVRNRKVRIG